MTASAEPSHVALYGGGGRAHRDTCAAKRATTHHPPLDGAALTLILLVPTLSAGGRGLYLTRGSPYWSSPKRPNASRISQQKTLFQVLGGGEGR